MNNFIKAVKSLDLPKVENLLAREPQWIGWAEDSGKNALHYLCAVNVAGKPQKADASLQILKLLLKNGMHIDAVHKIAEDCGFFPATPLWYAYAKGRNEKLFTWLLKKGADPEHCMFAIA